MSELSHLSIIGDPSGRMEDTGIELDGKKLPRVKTLKVEFDADSPFAIVTLEMYAHVDLDVQASVKVKELPCNDDT